MFTVLLLHNLFGIWIFIRKLNKSLKQNIHSLKLLTKIGTFYVLYLFILALMLKNKVILLVILIYFPLFLFFIFEKLTKIKREKQFRIKFMAFLTQLILQMRIGHSLRQSIALVNCESDVVFSKQIQKILNIVAFSQQNKTYSKKKLFIEEIIEEFIRIDRKPHMALDNLIHFKEKLDLESDFRRRSGQILYKVRVQAIIIIGIYLALLSFVLKNFSWKANSSLILSSLVLFLIGLVCLFLMGRSFKWNI